MKMQLLSDKILHLFGWLINAKHKVVIYNVSI